MWWKLLQAAVFFGIIGSDIQYHWNDTGNQYATAGIALLATFVVTALPLAIRDGWLKLSQRFQR